ncbi:MAG: T9SS type A sorting domain-containing protein [Flavobacteriales bacterium]
MRTILFGLLFFISAVAMAQEVVTGLAGNSLLSAPANQPLFAASDTLQVRYLYNLNKAGLPFIDDFSSDRLKIYSTDTAAKLSAVVHQYSFIVDGAFADTVRYATDTTWQYTTDSTKIAPNPKLTIVRYFADVYPAKVKDTLKVWPAYSIYGTDTFNLKKNLLSNTHYMYYFLADDASLWTGRGVFVNDNYPVSPPSIGVATFDAINSSGKMYNTATVTAYTADSLVSKPIDISGLSVSDNLYLSFYVEAKGYGDEPEDMDSLVLQFLDSNLTWRSVWNTSVKESWAVDSFFQFYVKLSSPVFFHDNFRFRFFSYASLDGFGTDVGNRDQWHLDYVVLDKNRSNNDNYISDVAFVYPPKTLLNGYHSVPWKHFKSAGGVMSGSSQGVIRNISAFPATVNFSVEVKENSSSLYTSAAAQSTSIPAGLTHSFTENYGAFVYTSAEDDSAVFDIQYALTTPLSGNRTENDIVSFQQELSNFYAYDDGSVEAGYGFYNTGVEFAYKLPILQSKGDSLRGVKIYFNEVLGAANYAIPFNIRVWAYSKGKPGALLYENSTDFPDSIMGINHFLYYPLDQPLFVKDTVFVGFKQTTNDYINIGLDFNSPNANKMFYYSTTSSSWKSSAVKGSVMFRPVLSEELITNPYSVAEEGNQSVQVFPNPASSEVFVLTESKAILTAFDINGREVSTALLSEGQSSLSLSGWSEGLYFLRITFPSGKTEFHKLVVR